MRSSSRTFGVCKSRGIVISTTLFAHKTDVV
ncbi:Protein of unknown function [Pyronema omphalodes CBS 100304]|uniref:Uncharacterized protein n=1 Tax=Pyronema omphalodes (strain CBS 100304) TaxID=1076935 RepID=U4LB01_PYROM|nr:Protein of unknown function [Pyronema omphalodes CBS 100304]